MAGTTRGSGRQAEGKLPGTSSKKTLEEMAREIYSESDKNAFVDVPSFLRNQSQRVKYRSPERRILLENSRYVDNWRDWHTTDGHGNPVVQRVDYGYLNWLAECCHTFEEVSGNTMALPQPGDGRSYFDALAWVSARWQTERLYATPKSRRMIMSWLMRCLDTADILFHPGRTLYVASEDLEKSEELVHRSAFLLSHIPVDCIPRHAIPPIETTRAMSKAGRHDLVNRITVRHSEQEPGQQDSFIQAVSQGDDLRGIGASRVTLEEFAMWKNAASVWSGLMGTLVGSGEGATRTEGRVVMVSTPMSPSFMRDIVLDKLGAKN